MSDDGIERRPGTLCSPVDGWLLHYDVHVRPDRADGAGALLVPATAHERDGYGPDLLAELTARGFTVMSLDVRGRGDSRVPRSLDAFPPGQRRAVGGDAAAALEELAGTRGVDPDRLVVFGEQDTAGPVAVTALGHPRVAGIALISAHLPPDIDTRGRAVGALACREEGRGLRDTVTAFARSGHPRSRLRVAAGVGAGTTMFSAWQFLHPSEPPLERWIAAWSEAVVAP